MLVLLVRLPAMTCEVRRMSATAAVVVVVVVPSVYSLIQSSLAACSSLDEKKKKQKIARFRSRSGMFVGGEKRRAQIKKTIRLIRLASGGCSRKQKSF